MVEDIKVVHNHEDKINGKWVPRYEPTVTNISIEKFKQSFVKERWQGERRTNKKTTKYGTFHTKTVVHFDENSRSVREFIFPE